MNSLSRRLTAALIALSFPGGAVAQSAPTPERTRGVRIITDAIPTGNVPNPAKVSIELAHGPDMALGAKVVFRVSAAERGYLVLLDVNAEGKLTQIYPNVHTIALQERLQQDVNLVKPGQPILLPNPANPLSNFEFVVEPPAGRGVAIALLSTIPIHMVDLPDIPADVLERGAEADFIYDAATKLRATSTAARALAAPKWSLAATRYAIR